MTTWVGPSPGFSGYHAKTTYLYILKIDSPILANSNLLFSTNFEILEKIGLAKFVVWKFNGEKKNTRG